MKPYILYTLRVKPAAKIQFQIKLPSTINAVEAIKVTHPFESQSTGFGYPIASDNAVGWLWLRVPDSRDVFYSEVLFPESHDVFEGMETDILSTRPEWHLNGSKHDFFGLDVPVKDTVIYGFYWDRVDPSVLSTVTDSDYQVKIYLKLC